MRAGQRCRLARFLADGRVIVVVDRDNGDECLEIWDTQDYTVTPLPIDRWRPDRRRWGRFTRLEASPKGEHVAFANHRNELWLLDMASGASRKLATNRYGAMGAFAWSPDGRWLAFQKNESRTKHAIAIASVETGEIRAVTEPLFADYAPSFDPDGRYLYFLSDRILNPVYDDLQFELSFPKAALPCLVTLGKDTPSPFLETASDEKDDAAKDKDQDRNRLRGDHEPYPCVSGARGPICKISGLKKKAMWLSFPVKGAMAVFKSSDGTLEAYDFKKLKTETLGSGFSGFRLSADRKQVLLFANRGPRVLKAAKRSKMKAPRRARAAGSICSG